MSLYFGQGWNHTSNPATFPRFANWLRIHDNGKTTWALIKPLRDGVPNWGGLDAQVAAAAAHGIPCMFVISGTPAWTAIQVSGAVAGIQGSVANCPPQPDDWAAFITALVTRYKGRIKWLEIRNEPNSKVWYCGTNAQLLALSQQAYAIVKSIDPAMLVTTPTPCWAETDVPTAMDTYLNMGFGSCADVVTFHGYQANGALGSAIGPTLDRLLAVLKKYNCKLPVIDTEFSFKTNQYADPNFVTTALVERIRRGIGWAWYQYDNQSYGTLYNMVTGELTPSGVAMSNAFALLQALPAPSGLTQI
jgi:hypothetical protein